MIFKFFIHANNYILAAKATYIYKGMKVFFELTTSQKRNLGLNWIINKTANKIQWFLKYLLSGRNVYI